MNLRSGRARALLAAPVTAAMLLILTACQTNVGAAATLDGSSVSEKTVDSYVNPTMKNLTYSSGQSVSPRTFVLQALLQEKVLVKIFAVTPGGALTGSQLAAAESAALQGTTEDAFIKQITDLGLPAKIEPHLLHTQEMAVLLAKRFTTQAAQQAVISKYGKLVSVSPRYGSWNPAQLSLTEFGRKQVPSMITYTSRLPGDVTASAAP